MTCLPIIRKVAVRLPPPATVPQLRQGLVGRRRWSSRALPSVPLVPFPMEQDVDGGETATDDPKIELDDTRRRECQLLLAGERRAEWSEAPTL